MRRAGIPPKPAGSRRRGRFPWTKTRSMFRVLPGKNPLFVCFFCVVVFLFFFWGGGEKTEERENHLKSV